MNSSEFDAVQCSSSRLEEALEEFTRATLESISSRVMGLLRDLRASRSTLECLGRVESVDCVCTETSEARSVTTPLHDDAARRVTEQLRRRVRKYRTTIGEEYHSLVPTDRQAFEKGFDSFVEECFRDVTRKQDQWLEDLVSSGAVEPHLRSLYINFQRTVREKCAAQAKGPLPPPLFRMESPSQNESNHIRSKTLTQVPLSTMLTGQSTESLDPSVERQTVNDMEHIRLPNQSAESINRLQEIQATYSFFDNRLRCQSFPGYGIPCSEQQKSSFETMCYPGVGYPQSSDHISRRYEEVARPTMSPQRLKASKKINKTVSFSKDVKHK